MIIFDELSHTYTHKDTNEIYPSVTTLIGKYEPEFDADYHSKRIALREGVPQQMILEEWERANKKATDKGTKIHNLMEQYIKSNEYPNAIRPLIDSFDKIRKELIDKHFKLLSEELLFDHDFKLAGTADLIFEHRDDFTVGDFKTNNNFRWESKYGERFFEPLSHLMVCEFNAYALQLSMYAAMYEKIINKPCKKLVIFYLDGLRWMPIHVNYLKLEALALITDYNKKKLDLSAVDT